MKLTFYISWIVFISLVIIGKTVTSSPEWMPKVFKMVQFTTYLVLALVPLLHKYEGNDKPKGIDAIYLEALTVSFCVRSMLFYFSYLKMDNRTDILVVFGGLMLGYYIFDVRKKLNAIEKTLL